MKRRFLIFVGVAVLVIALRLCDNGLLGVGQDGVFTVFGDRGAVTVYQAEDKPILDRFDGYTRFDTVGDIDTAKIGIAQLAAEILWSEQVDGITILYAYSPYINKFEIVHGQRVNVMVAVNGNNIAYGCPLLKGSY